MARADRIAFALRFRCWERRGIIWRIARLAAALEALISAGVNIIEAWDLAADASGSPALRRAVAAMETAGGRRPDAGRSHARTLPSISRTVRQSLRQRRSQRQTGRNLAPALRALSGGRHAQAPAFAQWMPRLIYCSSPASSPTTSSSFGPAISTRSPTLTNGF